MNLEALLQPLDGESPCGTDMSFSAEFDTLQQMRRSDDPTLDQGEWVTDLKVADWPGVVRLAEQLMSTRTKDLRLAGWLTEGAAHVKGYGGLADGLALYGALCRQFWPLVHPLPDEGDHELRAGSVGWLLGQVVQLSRALPLLQLGAAAYDLRDIEAARQLQQAQQRNPDLSVEGKVTMEQIARAQRETPASHILDVLDQCRRAQAELQTLQGAVDTHFGADGPGFSAARQALVDAQHEIERVARDAGALGREESASADPGGATPGADQAGGAIGGVPTTRGEALAQLRRVADFFRRTEPHSPVAYLADKAARWGDMPLHVWLRAVMKEPNSLSQLEDLLGVEPPSDEGRNH